MFAVISSIVVGVLLLYIMTQEDNKQEIQGDSNIIPNVDSKGGKNNPGFLIHTNIPWGGKENSDGCKFENFSSIEYGIRAWYINLFQKVNKGIITNTAQMIDVLTPAGKENAENARNNYKLSVATAKNWLGLGIKVFDFEANPDWKKLNDTEKHRKTLDGIAMATKYVYKDKGLPQYFNS